MRQITNKGEGGEAYLNEEGALWAVYVDGELYVRESPGSVVVGEDGALFLRASLEYAEWVEVVGALAAGTALRLAGEPGLALELEAAGSGLALKLERFGSSTALRLEGDG